MDRVVFSTLLYHRATPAVDYHATITFHIQGDIQ
jgi:hypothetical protein